MKTRLVLMAVCWSLVSAHASAATISFAGEGKSSLVEIRSNGFPSGVWTYAGELNWAWVGAAPDGFTPGWIYTYCVGADAYLNQQQTVTPRSTNALSMPGVDSAGEKVAWLLDTYAPGIHASGTGADAAALQVAIWEAEYDNDGDLAHGRFQLLVANDSNVRALAQSYLTVLFSSNYGSAAATWLDTPAGQDQVVLSPVPEGASLSLLVLGMGAGAWYFKSRLLHGFQSCARQTCNARDEGPASV